MVTGKTALLRAQRRWADAYGVHYDARGCVRALAHNLRAPLDESSLTELQRGSANAPPAILHRFPDKESRKIKILLQAA